MTGSTKRNTLILLGLVMIIIMIIAASLPQLELKPGMPPPRVLGGQVVVAPTEKGPSIAVSTKRFAAVLFVLIVAGAMLYTAYKLLQGADWKNIADFIRPMLIISIIVIGFIFLIMLLPDPGSSIPVEMPPPTSEPPITAPLGSVPPLLLWLVGIGLLAASMGVGLWIAFSRPPSPIDLVRLEAEKAWQALNTGLDLKDVIIKCYQQMSLALEKDQGIERKDFMTTGEFENLLEAAGIPHDPIHQLTRLFDAVRYGNWKPNPLDEKMAIESLEAIMKYSREAKGRN